MSSKQESKQETTYDPAYMARINENFDHTKGITDSPFQAFTGERVAGFSPTQIAGQGGLLAAANDPTGTNAYKSASDTISGLLSYRPPTIAAPTQVNANPITAGQLSGTDLTPYMNPFQKDVIDASIAQNGFARDQQAVKDNASATAAHAFGGSRQGVQRAETTGAYDRNNQINLADLNTGNFNQARAGAQYDIGNKFAADQFNSGQKLTAGMFNSTGAYNADVANAQNDITGANMRGNSALSLANLSDQQLRSALMRAGVISSVGDQQQAQQQNVDDASYEEFMRMINDPYQKQALRNSSLGAYPVQATTTNTSKSSPGIGGILGGILGGAQSAANLGWKPFG